MRTVGLLTCLAFASAQEGDETAYLLQTRTSQQKSGEVADCFVSGGCVTSTTTTTTEATTPSIGELTNAPPPRTTPQPTRPRRTRPPTAAPTAAPTPAPTPADRETDGDGEDHDRGTFCNAQHTLDVSTIVQNNLGGMGPDPSGAEEIRYNNVATVDGNQVHLVITTKDPPTTTAPGGKKGKHEHGKKGKHGHCDHHPSGPQSYESANLDCEYNNMDGREFVAKYNGNKHRTDVIAIGSLSKGDFTFTFSFVNDNDEPVVMDKLPMTFYDLDGKDNVPGKSYEVVTTKDAVMLEALIGSQVTHSCAVDSADALVCTAKSAKVEVHIPPNFETLEPDTKRAAITFFFENKSSFDITYTLNWEHRVFLFKPQCF